ncbi:MAG TPA: M20/M25/M40 family metallo-hydrolase [Blastocatellia bacterium]|nr:M20/M25/M40 family metallo-hydrolase [Blastocatellia bacterium]
MWRQVKAAVLLVMLMLLGPNPLLAQGPQEKVDLDVIAKIKEEGLQRSRYMEILSYLTDVYGPRLTGSPHFKEAAEWARQKFTEWGLQNAHLEPWGPFGRGWSLEGFTLNIIKPRFAPLIGYPKAWSPSTKGTVRGPVVYLDVKSEGDLEKYRGKLKGAIVLIAPERQVSAHFQPQGARLSDERLLALANADPAAGPGRRFQPSPEQRAAQQLEMKKWQLCYSEGAAVVLEPGRGDGGTIFVGAVTYPVSPDTPFDRRPRPWAQDAPPAIPQVVVAVEHYNRLVRMINKGVPVELEVGITSQFHDQDLNGYNVIAEIPGTDLKDEIVMLGAHFDSWHSGTGATDNAAGSAVVMEAVRILQALGIRPRRTIRVALWGGEEQGLLGSRAYVAEHFGRRIDPQGPPGSGGSDRSDSSASPRFELKPEHERFSAYFNLDNGTGKIRGVYMQGNEAVRPIFRAWLAPFRDMGASTLSLANTGGTDHLSFDAIGLPGFQFIQDPIEYDTRTHHSNMDVYDRIQEEDMKQAAVIMASFVYHAAMRDQKLPRKPLPGTVVAAARR